VQRKGRKRRRTDGCLIAWSGRDAATRAEPRSLNFVSPSAILAKRRLSEAPGGWNIRSAELYIGSRYGARKKCRCQRRMRNKSEWLTRTRWNKRGPFCTGHPSPMRLGVFAYRLLIGSCSTRSLAVLPPPAPARATERHKFGPRSESPKHFGSVRLSRSTV